MNPTTQHAALLPAYPSIPRDRIHLFQAHEEVPQAITILNAADVIGFDTESKPTFRKGELPTGPHLIQLATATDAFLFQVTCGQISEGLKPILASTRVLKVGIGLGNDRRDLLAKFGVELRNVLDLGSAIQIPGHRGTIGAKVAVAYFFKQRLIKSKKIGTSNWSYPTLSEAQLCYAANDAWVAWRIYDAWKKQVI